MLSDSLNKILNLLTVLLTGKKDISGLAIRPARWPLRIFNYLLDIIMRVGPIRIYHIIVTILSAK